MMQFYKRLFWVIVPLIGFIASVAGILELYLTLSDDNDSRPQVVFVTIPPASQPESNEPTVAWAAIPTTAPTQAPRALIASTQSPTVSSVTVCGGLLLPRLDIGDNAYVIPLGSGNYLNTNPLRPSRHPGESEQIVLIPENDIVTVIDGPVCGYEDNIVWWKVEYQNWVGWTGESGNGKYWLEKVQ